MSQTVAILGSTGSIGRSTLDVITHLSPRFEVTALSAGNNIAVLVEQIKTYHPQFVAVGTEQAASQLWTLIKDEYSGDIGIGMDGMVAVASYPGTECVISATVGGRGLLPTLKAIELGRRVGIANKEPLVMAGELMTRVAQESGAEILPIDSEHNALHQCLRGEKTHEVKRLILTASGGPFRKTPIEEFEQLTVAQALKHPTWQMGPKITIDSATLMNKGLEVIEARWLFGIDPGRVEVIVHPQSTVHSMVELIDGSVLAQLGVTDMRHPIQYALTYPDRLPANLPALDLVGIGKLEFELPDMKRFPCLGLAYQALQAGGTMPAVLNAANEIAVAAFLAEQIPFIAIPQLIAEVMDRHQIQPTTDLETILTADRWARTEAEGWITRQQKRVGVAE